MSKAAFEKEFQNVKVRVVNNILTIEVDLKKDLGKSKSGKTSIVGTTNGFVAIESHPGVAMGLNVVKK